MTLFLLSLLLVSGFAWARMWKRRLVIGAATAALFLYCWHPSALLVSRVWEMEYRPAPPARQGLEAIVVLSGGVRPPVRPLEVPILGPDTYVRSVYAAQLAHAWPDLPVVASGGRLEARTPSFAEAIRDELVRRGVPQERIWLEARSLTTYENALYTAELLRARHVSRIALVTSATHMRRAEAAFRRQGLEVSPAACAHNSLDTVDGADLLWPNRAAMVWNDALVHEIAGMAWYRLNGRL